MSFKQLGHRIRKCSWVALEGTNKLPITSFCLKDLLRSSEKFELSSLCALWPSNIVLFLRLTGNHAKCCFLLKTVTLMVTKIWFLGVQRLVERTRSKQRRLCHFWLIVVDVSSLASGLLLCKHSVNNPSTLPLTVYMLFCHLVCFCISNPGYRGQ